MVVIPKFKCISTVGLYSIIVITCLSCSKKEDQTIDLYSLVKKEYVYLPIDDSTPVNSTHISYLEANKQALLYILNREKQRIQVYDWAKKKMLKTIQLEAEGPNGVGTANSIYVDNPDSLYVLSSYNYRLLLLNNKGELIDKYILLEDGVKFDTASLERPRDGYSVLVTGNNANPLFKHNRNVIAGAFPNLDFEKEGFFKKGKYGISLNTETKKIKYIIPYPKTYLDLYEDGFRFPSQFVTSSLAFNRHKNILVISFPIDENLYMVNMDTDSISKYPANSKYIKKINLLRQNPSNPKEEFDFVVNSHSYNAVHYDPYRKLYLRYVLHPNPRKKDKYDNRPWVLLSVIILDEKFNKLGETMLEENMPGGTIFFRNDGIYMQKYNPNTEDSLTFVKYEISKN